MCLLKVLGAAYLLVQTIQSIYHRLELRPIVETNVWQQSNVRPLHDSSVRAWLAGCVRSQRICFARCVPQQVMAEVHPRQQRRRLQVLLDFRFVPTDSSGHQGSSAFRDPFISRANSRCHSDLMPGLAAARCTVGRVIRQAVPHVHDGAGCHILLTALQLRA